MENGGCAALRRAGHSFSIFNFTLSIMIADAFPNLARYTSLHPLFPEAVRFLQDPGLVALPDGRHEILDGGRLYASLQTYDTEPVEAGFLEGHQVYIDIQLIVSGRETIGWAPRENQPVATPYDVPRDIAYFHGACQPLRLRAGDFMILWPSDLHLPQRHFADKAERARKAVVKIKA